MTSIQKATYEAFKKLDCELEKKPTPEQVAAHLGKELNVVLRVLKKLDLYEEHELLTEAELALYRVYRKGLSLTDLSKMSGLTQGMVTYVLKQLSAKGVIERKKYQKANRDEAPPTYVVMVQGKYEGWRGYIGKNDKLTIFNCNGNEVTKFFEPNDYEVIERRV